MIMLILNNMKVFRLILFLFTMGINAQNKNTSDFFESHAVYRKVNNPPLPHDCIVWQINKKPPQF